jgi:hypothetical protein
VTKRIVFIALGTVLIVVGALTAIAGTALLVLFRGSDTLSSGPEHATTQTVALVTTLDDVQGSSGPGDTVGTPSITLSVTSSGRDVFIGVGPAAAVDRYLAGAPIERVTDLEVDPFKLKTVRRDGSATPQPPAAQSFWTAKASGPNPRLTWNITDGSYRLVVMNADSSPGVAIDGKFSLTVPHLFGVALGLLIGGVIALIIGVVLLVLGLRTTTERQQTVPVGSYPPPEQGPSPPPQQPGARS